MRWVVGLGLAVVLTAGCTLEVDFAASRYACSVDSDCPIGQSCADAYCTGEARHDSGAIDAGAQDSTLRPDAAASNDAPSLCGNGTLDPGEVCDDDAANAGGRCVACQLARCGDGAVRPSVEACDDGNTVDDDGCSNNCVSCTGSASSAIDGHCFSRRDASLSYQAAGEACAAMAAHLASYQDAGEALEVRDKLLLGDNAYWIGLDDRDREGVFVWATGEALSFESWEPGQPDDFNGNEDCVEQKAASGDMNDLPCGATRYFVCEDPGWLVGADGHAYRVFHDRSNWDSARGACTARGAHLVTIADAEEQAFVGALVNVRSWAGASDGSAEGAFEWTTGEPFAYSAWHSGEPNNVGDEDCLALDFFDDDTWNDSRCTDEQPYVCEID